MYYGLDVHKKFIQVCKLSKAGQVLANYQVGGDRVSVEEFAQSLKADDKVVLETTFNSWAVFDILSCSRAKVVVSDSNKVKAIAYAKVKTDKVDAEILARLLKADFIPEVQMPNKQTWQRRELVSHLRLLSKQRTMIKNAIWGILNRNLINVPHKNLFTKRGIAWLKVLDLHPLLRVQLDNLLLTYEAIESSGYAAEANLESIAVQDKNVQLLLSIPGVGLKVALGFVSAIGDVKRFRTPNQLAKYFGLTPSLSQSADKSYSGRITKQGTAYGRWLAVEAAQSLALSGSPITASYYKIKNKKGHNVAVTALARKLIVVVWHMLTKQQPYRYAKPERVAEKLKMLHPELPNRYNVIQEKISTEDIYWFAKLPSLEQPTAGEKRTAVRNKKQLTYLKRAQNPK
jgi:transposase